MAFFTLPAQIGVSIDKSLEVNLMTVPRKAKQKIGAIAKMTNLDGSIMTINVEYNQLEPLLQKNGHSEGDTNDQNTGFSPYPGNINQMLFAIGPYVENLQKMKGGIAEFVNPKYVKEIPGTFSTPTRLECMMQDYPKILSSKAKVGFTQAPAWLCFSPCKNNVIDASKSNGVPAWSAYTAESEQYFVWTKLLHIAGADVINSHSSVTSEDRDTFTEITTLERQSADGDIVECTISAISSPKVVFHPSFLLFPTELKKKIQDPGQIMLTPKSTLCISGDCSIRSLKLDGSLTVEYNNSSASSSSRCLEINFDDDFILKNEGHNRRELYTKDERGKIPHEQFQAIRDPWSRAREVDRIRGYIIEMTECKCVVINDTRGGGEAAVDVSGTTTTNAAATTTAAAVVADSSSRCSNIVFDGKGVAVRYASERNISMTLS